MSPQGGSSADPFNAPAPQGTPGAADRTEFSQFISATPMPGYVYSPELALYVDPNMPKHLQPHFVSMTQPGTGRKAVVPYTGAKPTAFLDTLQQPVPTDPGAQPTPGFGAPSTQQDLAAFINGPTTRPNEPVTAGVPVGAGPQFIRIPGESDTQFRQRVSEGMLSSSLKTDPLIRSFALRLMEGN